jgi:photosystem II stability/assembly factor-like uncharacterized protein
VNTVEDLRQALSDEVRRLQPPAGLEARVLQQAVRGSGVVDLTPRAGRGGAFRSWEAKSVEAPRPMALVAVLLAVAIVVSLLFAAQALHQTRPVPVKRAPIHGVATSKPIPVNPPTSVGCPAHAQPSDQCTITALTFVSPNVIWATVESVAPRPGETPGPLNIYRTDDGGQHWRGQASWDNPGSSPASSMSDSSWGTAEPMTVSSDGREALFVTPWGSLGSSVFHTNDAGAPWASFGFPLSAQPTQLCRNNVCDQGEGPGLQTYFLNPREGWLVSKDPTGSADDLFHTTDSGATWTLFAHVATATNFDLLHGQLVFQSSLGGWFVPDYYGNPLIARTVFRTVDGGLTWRPITLGAVSVTTHENKPGEFVLIHEAIVDIEFFNSREGVIELQNASSPGAAAPGTDPTYVYTTSDGGTTWSASELIPTAIDFIDANHWFAWGLVPGHLSRTDDGGRSWQDINSVLDGGPIYAPSSFEFVDLSHGIAFDFCLAISTVDGGLHWEPLNLPAFNQQCHPV